MTPKEKAKYIVDRMYYTISNNGSYMGENSIPHKWEEAKKCALIAVDEIVIAIDWHEFETPNKEIEYWQEVKQEIEKL
jgi:hypothetical protein